MARQQAVRSMRRARRACRCPAAATRAPLLPVDHEESASAVAHSRGGPGRAGPAVWAMACWRYRCLYASSSAGIASRSRCLLSRPTPASSAASGASSCGAVNVLSRLRRCAPLARATRVVGRRLTRSGIRASQQQRCAGRTRWGRCRRGRPGRRPEVAGGSARGGGRSSLVWDGELAGSRGFEGRGRGEQQAWGMAPHVMRNWT